MTHKEQTLQIHNNKLCKDLFTSKIFVTVLNFMQLKTSIFFYFYFDKKMFCYSIAIKNLLAFFLIFIL